MNPGNLNDPRLAGAISSVEMNRERLSASVDELDTRMHQMVQNVSEAASERVMAPLRFLRRHPLACAGAALALGVLIGIRLPGSGAASDPVLKDLPSSYLP